MILSYPLWLPAAGRHSQLRSSQSMNVSDYKAEAKSEGSTTSDAKAEEKAAPADQFAKSKESILAALLADTDNLNQAATAALVRRL